MDLAVLQGAIAYNLTATLAGYANVIQVPVMSPPTWKPYHLGFFPTSSSTPIIFSVQGTSNQLLGCLDGIVICKSAGPWTLETAGGQASLLSQPPDPSKSAG